QVRLERVWQGEVMAYNVRMNHSARTLDESQLIISRVLRLSLPLKATNTMSVVLSVFRCVRMSYGKRLAPGSKRSDVGMFTTVSVFPALVMCSIPTTKPPAGAG